MDKLMNQIVDKDPEQKEFHQAVDEVIEKCMAMLDWLIEQKLLFKDTPKEHISGAISCPFCDGDIEYWQSDYNGHRGFSCECIGGTFQE